jgi:hypothetical protein
VEVLKTYTNVESGYSINYPTEWFSTDCDGQVKGLFLSKEGMPECATEPSYPIQFYYNSDIKNIEGYIGAMEQSGFKYTQMSSPVDGFMKYKIVKAEAAQGPDSMIEYYKPHKSGTFVLVVNKLEEEKTGDSIVSSFTSL